MFGFLFGWRKASKCKKLIKQVQCRLKLLKNKRAVIAKQLREDVQLLIQNGYDQTAFNRVEQIVRDENRMAAYEILDSFCEFILLNLSYIRKHKECPNDVNEAVSSLMFASARCGDLPELQLIRKLFGDRYGRRFETAADELCPGNLVNLQMKEKLLTNSVSDDDKLRMMIQIARDCIQPQVLALEYRSDWHQNQVQDDKKTDQHKNQAVKPNETKTTENKQPNSATNTSSESLPQFPEDRIVYLDDVTELCPSTTTTDKDQRLFTFKTEIHNQTEQSESSSKASAKTENNDQNQQFENQIKGKNLEENWGYEEANFYKKAKRRKKSSSSSLRNKREGLYLRAVTLPPERQNESQKVNFGRTNSCPYKQPSHVHPKLPDYDDIAAKFMALKRQHLQNNTHFKS